MGWQIECQKGSLAGQTFALDQATLGFGRSADNRVAIPNSQASRHHAEIRLENGQPVIYDLGSSNGTKVNNERISQPRPLEDLDKITIADCVFQLQAVVEAATMPDPAEEMYPRLLRLNSTEQASYQMDKLPLTLGRDNQNQVIIQGRQASRYHAEIRQSPEGPVIADLGSSNGTYVNGARLRQPQLLRHNDRLEIGGEALVYLAGPASPLNQPQLISRLQPTPAPFPLVNQPQPTVTPAVTPRPLPPTPAPLPLPVAAQRPGQVEYGIKCPGRCGRTWPLHIEHCPIDGYLLANGQSVLLDVIASPQTRAS